MKKIFATILLFTAFLFAQYQVLTSDSFSGGYHYCYYTGGYAKTVKGYENCPLSIDE